MVRVKTKPVTNSLRTRTLELSVHSFLYVKKDEKKGLKVLERKEEGKTEETVQLSCLEGWVLRYRLTVL